MKKKLVRNKIHTEKRDEFRKHKNEPHPKYVFERKGENYNYLSMTHKPPKETAKDYVPLNHSANPKDKRKAYINTKSESDNMGNFGARKIGWKFTDSDRKIVKGIVKKNKKGKQPFPFNGAEFDVSPYIVKLQMAIHFRVDLNITTAEFFTVFVNRIIIIRDTK